MVNNRKDPNSREIYLIELMSALDHMMDAHGKYIEERLRTVPDLYRQFRIAKVALGKTVDGLYETLPAKTLMRIQHTNNICEVVIRPISSLNKSTDMVVVPLVDIRQIISEAMASSCAMCLKSGKEIKRCELRKAFRSIEPIDETTSGLCEYAKAIIDGKVEDDLCK